MLASSNVGLIAVKTHATLRYSQLRLFNIQLPQIETKLLFEDQSPNT